MAREIQKLTEKLSGFIQENIEKNMSAKETWDRHSRIPGKYK